MSYGLLLIRLVLGGTTAAHGAQKLFGWFGESGSEGTAGFFAALGVAVLAASVAGSTSVAVGRRQRRRWRTLTV